MRQALYQLGRALVAVLLSAAERQDRLPDSPATTAAADHRRPLEAGDRPEQHEDRASLSGHGRGLRGDRRDQKYND